MPNQPAKRPPTKTSKQVHKKFHMSMNMLAGLIVLGIVLIFAGFNIKNYVAEQQTLRELDTVGKDLKVIYDKIVEANKGNIDSSEFGKSCSESSVKYGRGQVTCGIGGRVTLKNFVSLGSAKNIFYNTRTSSNEGPLEIFDSEYTKAVTIEYGQYTTDIVCSGYYEQALVTKQWYFGVSCRKTVPDFLPGYTVE